MNYANTTVKRVTVSPDNFADEGLLRSLLVIKPMEEPVDIFGVEIKNNLVEFKLRVKHA